MNGSTFCEIKYMKGYLYMIRIGVGLKILASHTHTKITHKLLPHAHTPSPKRDLYLSKNVP